MQKKPAENVIAASLAAAGAVGAGWGLHTARRAGAYRQLHRTMVDVLLNALTAGDLVTGRHSRRVADLTDVVARSYRLSRAELATIRVAALLHDMGKIDDRFFDIVHSCEPLSEEQRHEIKQHPHESAHILKPLEEFHPGIMRIVAAHHEHWDGNGYPRGLEGVEIPLGARIISAADVFDAMSEPRTYRDALPVPHVLAEIRRGAGRRFDPEVVRRIERPHILAQWEAIASSGRDEERARQE